MHRWPERPELTVAASSTHHNNTMRLAVAALLLQGAYGFHHGGVSNKILVPGTSHDRRHRQCNRPKTAPNEIMPFSNRRQCSRPQPTQNEPMPFIGTSSTSLRQAANPDDVLYFF